MLPESTNESQKVSPPTHALDSSTSSNHGQHPNSHDPQVSQQPPFHELQAEPSPPTRSDTRDSTRPPFTDEDNGDSIRAGQVDQITVTPPLPGRRITEYENAHVNLPRNRSNSPLFQVTKEKRSSDDKSSPISGLPTGE